jgi:hypothetical protein
MPIWILLLAAAPLLAQSDDRSTIEGEVRSAATDEPIKKASVILRRADAPPPNGGMPLSYSTATDAGGKFAMKDIEPGRYRLVVNRAGFVVAEYGAKGASRPGATLALERGQHVKDIAIKLTQHAVITGRVLDENNEPVVYAQVQALRYRYNQGRKQLMPGGGGSTNDLGEYRIFGLPPGRYYLSATYRTNMMMEPSMDRSAAAQPDEDYVATYYPGTIDPASAAAIDAPAGGQVRGLDFTLSKTRTVRVRGRVVSTGGPRRGNITVMLLARDRMPFFGPNRTSTSDPNGAFELRGVVPGAYYLTVAEYSGDRVVTAKQPLDVGGSNLDNVNITLGDGMEMAGRIRTEGDAPAALSSIRVMLRPHDASGMMYGPTPEGRVKDDGTFTLTRISPDHYDVTVMGLGDSYYVKSVRAGEVDVLTAGMNLNQGPAGPLDILISPNAGRVEGQVQNDKQQPVTGATVVLIPAEEGRRDRMQYYKTITTDQNGLFSLKNVDPGQYKAYAWEDMEFGAFMDPEVVKPVESRGEPVTVREKGTETLQLKMIAAEITAAGGR